MPLPTGLLALGGIAEGLKSGLTAYRDESRYQDEKVTKEKQRQEDLAQKKLDNQLRNDQLRMQAEVQGLIYDPENHTLGQSELLKAKRQSEAQELSLEAGIERAGILGNVAPGLIDASKPVSSGRFKEAAPFAVARQKGDIDRRNETAKSKAKNAPKTATSLKGDERKRYDWIKEGLSAIDKFESGLQKGQSPGRLTGLVGDNDVTSALRLWSEAIGRMQSGGVIGPKEAEEFKAMLPTFRDTMGNPQIVAKKIKDARELMNSRLSTLGLSLPEGEPDEDAMALQWAEANPDDDRAKEILRMHGR